MNQLKDIDYAIEQDFSMELDLVISISPSFRCIFKIVDIINLY